jgi:glycosyltransferase involved in cell wall biosynthesis
MPLNLAVIQRFLPSRSRGGVGYFTHGLCNGLCRRGHTVTVFSQDPTPDDALYTVRLLRATRSVAGYPSAPLTFPFQVARQDFSAFDLVHAQGDDQLLPHHPGRPVVRTMHGSCLVEAFHNGWQGRSVKRLLMHAWFYGCELLAVCRADAVVGVSRDTLRYYPRSFGVIPNGIDPEYFRAPDEPKSEQPSVLFVGDLDSRKRGRLLLRVFRKVVRIEVPTAELWLVCPECVCEEGVRWLGRVSLAELVRLYRRAWVFCLPSSYEGFGRPYAEALASGTPVVATRNVGAVEVLGDGAYGEIVADADLGAALCRLLRQPDLRERFSSQGRARAWDYAWDRVVEQYERLYEAVLRRRARS